MHRWLAEAFLLIALAAPAAQDSAPAAQEQAPVASEGDKALETAVGARLAENEDLDGLRVEVKDGIAVLRGAVISADARAEAERVVRSVPGVVEVRNEVETVWNVPGRLRPVLDQLSDVAFAIVALIPLLAVALVVLVASWYLARFVSHRRQPFTRLANPFVRDLVRQVTRVGVFLLGVLIALEIVGATAMVGAVLGTAGVVSLVVGLAFRDLAENYLATVLLSLRQPFQPDDHVVIEGREGRIVRLTSRATLLMTLDGNHVYVPNAVVFKGVIMNYTRNPLRRFEFVATVAKDVDLAAAQAAVLAAIRQVTGVRADPAPSVEVVRLWVDHNELAVVGWVDQRAHQLAKVRSEAQRRTAQALARPLEGGRATDRRAAADTTVDHDLEAQIAAERLRRDGDMLALGGRPE